MTGWEHVAIICAQALRHARPFVPEYTGKGEFARDDVDEALAAYSEQCRKADAPTPQEPGAGEP